MLNPTTKEMTVITITLATAVKGSATACTALLHAPSSLERTWTAVSTDKGRNEVALKAMAEMTGRITGHDIVVRFASDNKYMNDMFGGEYRRKLMAGEAIEYDDLWKQVIANLRSHRCHLETAPMPDDEVTERAKATAKFYVKKAAAAKTQADEAA